MFLKIDNMLSEEKNNKYDYLLILSVLVCGLGYIGAPIYPARIFAILLIPFTIKEYSKLRLKIPSYLRNFLYIWFVFALLSLLWTCDFSSGVRTFIYLSLNIISFISICLLSLKANKPIQSIFIAWIMLVLLMSPIAFYEFSTGQHVISSYQETDLHIKNSDGTNIARTYAYVTFGALNAYNVVLCYCLTFIVASFFYFQGRRKYICLFIILLLIVFQILINASRGALLCLGLSILVLVYKAQKTKLIPKVWFISMFAFAFILIYLVRDLVIEQILGKILENSLLEDKSRTSILSMVMNVFWGTLGLGVGIGGNDQAISSAYPLYGISATHNLFLEFLLQFGMIPFFYFIYFIYRFYMSSYRNQQTTISVLGVLLIVTSLPMFIIDSGYLLTTILWVYWGSAFAILMVSKIKRTF